MDFNSWWKNIKSKTILVLVFTFIILHFNFSAGASAGELDDTLKKLLSAQQTRHNEDVVMKKIKDDPATIEELFSSKQGILARGSLFKKKQAPKSSSKKKAVKKSAPKKAVQKVEAANREPESLEDILTAQSLIVLDEDSGKLLYSKDPFKKMAPASLTKIMTAIVLLGSGRNLNETITIKHDIIVRSDAVALGLKKGDRTTLQDLLYMALLYSANDACVAIAEEVAGSVSGFAKMMNKRAREIGALNSNFVNPNGMPDSRHYSTAYDLAVLSSYAMKDTTFSKIVGTRRRTVKLITHKEISVKVAKKSSKTTAKASKSASKSKRKVKEETVKKIVEVTRTINLSNRHKLLGKTDGVRGIKTGYTKAAGRCLATAYSYGGKKLIIIVLKARDVNSDTIALIDCDKYLSASNIVIKSGTAEKPAVLSAGPAQQKASVTLSTVKIVK
ncbi:MAG: D-alanyl-D-alanine carboxypeptidase [uncultured bacterium]|nr:MAG: D-alanyl-D-alanine carboxypeptidase [uncultured bacterium]